MTAFIVVVEAPGCGSGIIGQLVCITVDEGSESSGHTWGWAV